MNAKILLLKTICELEYIGELDSLFKVAETAGIHYPTAYTLHNELREEGYIHSCNNGSGSPIDIETTENGRRLAGQCNVTEMSDAELLDALRHRVEDGHGKRLIVELNSRLKRIHLHSIFGEPAHD